MFDFQSDGLTNVLVYLVVVLGIASLAGYLFNYFVIKELKVMNKYLKDLTDVLGYNLKSISDKTGSGLYFNANRNIDENTINNKH